MELRKLSLLTAAILVITGCNSDKKQIIKAAEGYLEATGNYRIEEAYPYASKETRETTLRYISEIIIPMTDTNYIKSNSPAEISIDSILYSTDTAWVFYTKTTPLKTLQNTICLIREDGEWLVDVPLDLSRSPLPLPRLDTAKDTSRTTPSELLQIEKAQPVAADL